MIVVDFYCYNNIRLMEKIMETGNIKWIFFDMGSTLIEDTQSYHQWFTMASNKINGALSPSDIAREYSAGMARYKPTLTKQLEPYGFSGNATDFYPTELDRPYLDSYSVLDYLYGKYNLGVIANQNEGAERRLQEYGLRKYFDVIIASYEVGLNKPDLRIFKLALKQANCLPNEAIMIGDRPDNDIYPAKKLGMRTIRIKQGYASSQEPKSAEYAADATVDNLKELLEVFNG